MRARLFAAAALATNPATMEWSDGRAAAGKA
jgi:hypothetical protein